MRKKSRHHIQLAANDFRISHYMGDVAKVHEQLRNAAAKAEPAGALDKASSVGD